MTSRSTIVSFHTLFKLLSQHFFRHHTYDTCILSMFCRRLCLIYQYQGGGRGFPLSVLLCGVYTKGGRCIRLAARTLRILVLRLGLLLDVDAGTVHVDFTMWESFFFLPFLNAGDGCGNKLTTINATLISSPRVITV